MLRTEQENRSLIAAAASMQDKNEDQEDTIAKLHREVKERLAFQRPDDS